MMFIITQVKLSSHGRSRTYVRSTYFTEGHTYGPTSWSYWTPRAPIASKAGYIPVFLWKSIATSDFTRGLLPPFIPTGSAHGRHMIMTYVNNRPNLKQSMPIPISADKFLLWDVDITWFFAYCKGGNFNIHTCVWFSYSIALEGKSGFIYNLVKS